MLKNRPSRTLNRTNAASNRGGVAKTTPRVPATRGLSRQLLATTRNAQPARIDAQSNPNRACARPMAAEASTTATSVQEQFAKHPTATHQSISHPFRGGNSLIFPLADNLGGVADRFATATNSHSQHANGAITSSRSSSSSRAGEPNTPDSDTQVQFVQPYARVAQTVGLATSQPPSETVAVGRKRTTRHKQDVDDESSAPTAYQTLVERIYDG